jgi:hypothetical protein
LEVTEFVALCDVVAGLDVRAMMQDETSDMPTGTKATRPMTGPSASMRMIARAATLDIGGKTVGSRLTRW